MAKKAGADVAPKISLVRGHSADEHNAVVTEASFLQAVKEINGAREIVRAANVALKSKRAHWKASGIALGVLDSHLKMADWSRGEVRDHFDTERRYAEWLGLPVEGRPAEMFKGLSDDEVQRREWWALGKTYSRSGKPGRPPEECPPDFHQAFMRGFNEEDEAAWADGAGEEAAPEAEVAQAEYYNQPPWSGFSTDPDEWFAAQKTEFAGWFESLPAGALVKISHAGIRKAFVTARDDEVREGGETVTERVADAPRLEGETWPPAIIEEDFLPKGDPEAIKPGTIAPVDLDKGAPKSGGAKGGEKVH